MNKWMWDMKLPVPFSKLSSYVFLLKYNFFQIINFLNKLHMNGCLKSAGFGVLRRLAIVIAMIVIKMLMKKIYNMKTFPWHFVGWL